MASEEDKGIGSHLGHFGHFGHFGQKLHDFAHDIHQEIEKVEQRFEGSKHESKQQENGNRYQSFAPTCSGNDLKWFIDGCGYFWAVSIALEEARESIWILDWWLTPELYLRRPPSLNEQYRLDRLLLSAAQRGVKVNIIVYKEVSAVEHS